MGAWSSWQLPSVPSGLTSAASTAKTVTSTITKALSTVKDVLSTLSELEIDRTSAAQTLIKTAVTTLESSLTDLLKGSGVYVLAVPIRKHVVIPSVVQSAMDAVGISELPAAEQTLAFLNISSDLVDNNDPTFATQVAKAMSTDGGNAGFYRTVIESLTDDGDENRPQLSKNDAVTGFCIVAGAADYAMLSNFLSAFKSLTGPRRPSMAFDAPAMPVPQNVKARVVTGDKPQVKLEWDEVQPFVPVPTLGTNAEMYQVAVIRSQSSKLVTRYTAAEIFGTSKLTKGMTAGVGDDLIEVIDVFESSNTKIISDYYDTGLTLDGTYYYAVSFNVKAGGSVAMMTGQSTEQGFAKLSNTVKVHAVLKAPASGSAKSSSGAPPDWIRTPSVVDLFPDISEAVNKLSLLLGSVTNYTATFGDTFKAYIQFLDQEIKEWEQLVESIAGPIQRLSGILSSMSSAGGLYIHSIEGQGGLPFIMKDLGKAFLDKKDLTRPPFDSGTEFVTGLIVLAAAPTQVDLAPIKAALAALLQPNASEDSVIAAAIKEIDKQVAQVETVVFTDSRLLPPTDSTVLLPSGIPAIGSSDTGLDNCPVPVTSTTAAISYIFADNFEVISGG
jgi:hypothetical protein